MKKAFMVVVALVLLLSGCEKTEEKSKKLTLEDLKCSFTASVEDVTVSGDLFLPAKGNPEIKVTSPMELAGMKLVLEGEAVHIKHLGVSMDIPISQYPALSVGNTIVSVLSDARKAEPVQAEQRDNGYLLCGQTSFGEYELLVDEQMSPVELVLPDKGFICEFIG